jgi:hypothetical protein
MSSPYTATEMRLAYLESELGCYLRKDSATTYSAISACDGAIMVGPGESLATMQAHAGVVDETIQVLWWGRMYVRRIGRSVCVYSFRSCFLK